MTTFTPPAERDLPREAREQRRALLESAVRDMPGDRREAFAGMRAVRTPARLGAVGIAGAAATVAAMLLTSGGATTTSPAEAAVFNGVAAALAPPSGAILHERAMVSADKQPAQLFELWVETSEPHAYRVIKWGTEGGFDGSSHVDYEASDNTVRVSPPVGENAVTGHGPIDLAASLRALAQSGHARVAGETTIDGVPAYEITAGNDAGVLPPGSIAYVAQSDYHPLVLDYAANGGEVVDFSAYEYLPANAANASLLDVRAQHPGARVVQTPPEGG
jgi:hypothetical protein